MFQGQGNPKQKSSPANCSNVGMSEKLVQGQIPEFNGSPLLQMSLQMQRGENNLETPLV